MARVAAAASGFLTLIQVLDGPERYDFWNYVLPATRSFRLISLHFAASKMSSVSNGCFPKGRMIFCYRGFFPSISYSSHQPIFASPPPQGPTGGCSDTHPRLVLCSGQRHCPPTKR